MSLELDEDTFAAPPAAAADATSFGNGAAVHDGDDGLGSFTAASGPSLTVVTAEAEPDAVFDDNSAFLGGWAATPPAAPAAAAAPAPPTEEDPRLQWQRKHADELKVRDKEESAAKAAAATKAKEHIGKFYESRKTLIASRHKDNRTDAEPEAEVPAGATPWEKVTALVNFGASAAHATDVTRYKETLVACKTRNVAIRG